MARYRRNGLREEYIARGGQTVDLPLFTPGGSALPVSEIIPKSIAVATDTKRLSRTIQQHNPFALGDDQQKVYDLLLNEGPLTNKEMARRLGWDASTVSARNYEIREIGLVVADKKRICSVTGNVVQAWRVK